MHKTTIALGTALLCTAGAHAQSTVQITGTVDAFAGAMKMAGDASRQSVVNSGGLTSSWFGFKGSEDLGGGLSGNFGTVLPGHWMAPNFLPSVVGNPLGDSFTFSPLILHMNVPLFNGTGWAATSPSDTGWSNQIVYSTPKSGGFQANFQYQLSYEAGELVNIEDFPHVKWVLAAFVARPAVVKGLEVPKQG